jgi:hypothetical protein
MPRIQMEKVTETKESVKNTKVDNLELKNDPMLGFYPITDLPSKYKLYPENTLIYGRPLRVIEAKQLSQMSEGNSNTIMNNVLRSAIKGINVDDILVADKLYIIFWLRANSYKDSGFKVDFNCLECETKSSYHFNLDSLKITYISDDYSKDKEFMLPINKHEINMRYQRIKDAVELENFKSKNSDNPLVSYDDDILSLASCINLINGEDKTLKQKYDYLIGLDVGDYSVISTEMTDNEIGISTIINVKCSKCEKISFAGLDFREDFFIPKYKT